MNASTSIRRIAPTVCRAFGIGGFGTPLFRARVEKCFIFAVDSVPIRLANRLRRTRRLLKGPRHLRAVYPTVTPVCFASMFTGLSPRAHGITKYEKPALRRRTMFDAMIEIGLRIAIVCVKDQSIDKIFRGRRMDYFSEAYDPQVVSRAIRLVRENRHDLILAYNQAYDDANHATYPTSRRALKALASYDANCEKLFEAVERSWRQRARLFLWVTDHGCHFDGQHGAHGARTSEDMNVPAFYRISSV